MKKYLLLLLTFLLFHTASAQLFSYKYEGTELWYQVVDSKAKTCKLWYANKSVKSVVIPEYPQYNGTEYTLTEIYEKAFNECTELTSVEIPNSVKTIGNSAFSGCTGLTSLKIPNSVTNIGKYAFSDCTGLTSLEIPNSVTDIMDEAFSGCTGLTEIKIEDGETFLKFGQWVFKNTNIEYIYLGRTWNGYFGHIAKTLKSVKIGNLVQYIQSSAFSDFTVLTSIEIGNSVTAIGEKAFYKCSGLTSIIIPDKVTSIQKNVFNNCSSLESVTIPNSVMEIGESAFSGCTALKQIILPESLKNIDNYAFKNCSGITELILPNSLQYINYGAFEGCSNLSEITFGNSIKSIENRAFNECTSLTEIILPPSIVGCDGSAFLGCTNLIKNAYPETIKNPFGNGLCIGYPVNGLIEDGIVYDTQKESVYFVRLSVDDTYALPTSVTRIGKYAFAKCDGLASFTIPDHVTSINDYAFSDCSALSYVNIGNSVATISDYAFSGCSALTSVELPSSVSKIGKCAFSGCSALDKIRIDDGTTRIDFGQDALQGTKIDSMYIGRDWNGNISSPLSLQSITFGPFVTTIGYEAFYGCSGLSEITIPQNIKSIGDKAFQECSGIKKLTIEDGNDILDMGSEQFLDSPIENLYLGRNLKHKYYPFSNKTSLKELVIGSGVTIISDWEFRHCTGLTSLTLSKSVTLIGNSAFRDCTGIKNIIIPESVITIGDNAFYGCTGLTSIDIGNSVTTIGNNAFYGCNALSSVEIPNSVISIGERSFSGCTGLTSIGIGNSVTTIGNNAFNSCNALSSVEIPNSVISIGERSFSGCTGLTSIGIGNSVTTIGNEAFKGCSGVKTFIIPKSVTSVGNDAFAKCYTLVKSAYPETLKNPFNFGLCFSYPVNSTIEDGVIYDTNKEKIYFVTSDIEGDFNIPESVKEIGPSAFQDCNRLTSVTLPDHINNIEDLAFKNCSGLTSIQIPDSLTHIAKSVFENCTGLTSVKLGESITLIDESAFNRCTTLASVENCDNLQTIGSYAFLNCPSLASLDNCVNLQTIGRFAFSNCSNLVSLGNCDNLQTIGMYAFQNCTNLVSFGNGENLKVIDGGAFENCKALGSSLTLSKCSIKSDAFKGCSSLKDISLKSCELWDRVFSGCTELNTINLSGDMYFWGDLIFMRGIEVWKDCPNIKDVYYTSGKPMEMNSNSFDDTVYKQATLYLRESSREEALKLTPWKLFENIENIPSFVYEYAGQTLLYEIIDENTCLVAKQHHLNGDLSIPETAFYRGTGYKVVSISQYAFEGSGINSVILPESVLTIETGAFASCGNLESVAIPNSVSEIGDRAFESCRKLTKLTIGDNVRTFGESIWHSCPEITEIYYQSLNPVGGYDNMFENTVYEKAMLYLAEEVREEAQHLTPWCNFKHIYRLPGEEYLLTYEYEGEEARVVGFKPDYEVDVIIPASVTKDGVEYAVTSIDNTAFKDSELLMSVVIPETIRNIQAGAFANCPILTKVNYNAIEAICDDNAADNPVFANCPKLNDIEIGESVITLPQYIFKSTNIKSIVIPDNVTILSEGCFAECYQLEDITIGKGVKAMRADAFGLKNPSDNPVTLHFNAINLEEYSGKDGDFGYGTECLPLSNRNVDKIIFGNEVETLCAYAFCECMPNVIESHNPVPPILGIACFESTNKETCKLIIPEGSLTSYSMADIWMEFLNVDASLSGIEDVLTDENCIVKIYTLEGLKIYDGSACEMPALNGLYIIIRKGKAEKVYLRN